MLELGIIEDGERELHVGLINNQRAILYTGYKDPIKDIEADNPSVELDKNKARRLIILLTEFVENT